MTNRPERIRFARNAVSSYGVRVPLALSALLLTPYLYRSLGESGFGTWSIIFALASVFSLLQIGFTAGITKFVAELNARGTRAELEALVGSSLALMLLVGLLATGVSVALALGATGLAADGDQTAFQTSMIVIGAVMAIRLPCIGCSAVLNGYQRYDASNAAWMVSIVAFPLGAVIAVEAGLGITGVSISYAAALLLGSLASVAILRRVDPGLKLRPRGADLSTFRRIAGFSSLTMAADSMIFVSQRLDTVFIGALASAVAAAPYAAAVKLQSGLQSLTLPFVELLMPMVSDLSARGDREGLRRRFMISTRVALQITAPVAIAMAIFAEDIIAAWLGGSAVADAALIIVVLMAAQILTLSGAPAREVLIGIGRARLVAGLAMLEGAANLGVSIALIVSFGAIGAALGTLFAALAFTPVRIPIVARAVGCSTLRVLRESYAPAVASTLPGVAVMVVIYLGLEPGFGRAAAGICLGLGLAALVAVAQVGPRHIGGALRGLNAPATGPEG